MAAAPQPPGQASALDSSFSSDLPTECAWCGRTVRVIKAHPWLSAGIGSVVVGIIVLIAVLDVASKVIICAGALGIAGLAFYHSRKSNTAPLNTDTAVQAVKATVAGVVGSAGAAAAAAAVERPETWLARRGFKKDGDSNEWTFIVVRPNDISTPEDAWATLGTLPATVNRNGNAFLNKDQVHLHGAYVLRATITANPANPFGS